MRARTFANGGRGVESDRGSVGVWARAPILLTQLSGFGDGRFAEPIISGFDEVIAIRGPAQVFFDMGGMENYESALRTRLTSHFSQHRAQIAALHVFTRSKLVAMGVAVANLALGGMITNHETQLAFHAALDRAVAASRVTGLTSAALAR